MSGHTKGPWRAELDGEWKVVGPEQGEWVADCGFGGNSESCARLIAAAPDMYEALKAHETYCETGRESDFNQFALLRDRAIAKAEVSQ